MTSRRTFIKDASLLALATMAPFRSVFAAGNTTVGVIYVGARGDYGYNQAQASAAAIIKKLPNVKVVEEENVPETIAVQKTMEAMIEQDGATLVFADRQQRAPERRAQNERHDADPGGEKRQRHIVERFVVVEDVERGKAEMQRFAMPC